MRLFWGLFTLLLTTDICLAGEYGNLNIRLHQILKDNVDGIDGLDNARQVVLSEDEKSAYVVSADDNSVAVFNIAPSFQLSLRQVLRSDETKLKLEGAVSVVTDKKTNQVYVLSFYDGALTRFSLDAGGKLKFEQEISDDLSPQRVFKDTRPISLLEDTYGLLGGYHMTLNEKSAKLLVAATISDSLSIFNIERDGRLVFQHAIRGRDYPAIKGVVSVAVTGGSDRLSVASMAGNAITFIDKNTKGKYSLGETITNGMDGIQELKAPAHLVSSTDGQFLFIANMESSGVIVLKKNQHNRYRHFQTINKDDDNGTVGVGHVSISADGKMMAISSELAHTIKLYGADRHGKWHLNGEISSKTVVGIKIEAPTSTAFTENSKFVLVTFDEGDALHVYKL